MALTRTGYPHMEIDALRACVHAFLLSPFNQPWSVQGFGMLRTYFGADKKYRLNIWDSALAVKNVSILHTHPWHFTSWIMSGKFKNQRFYEARTGLLTHDWAVIKTGEGGGPDGEKGSSRLLEGEPEFYMPGDTYMQSPEEIHASYFEDGTVTLNVRKRVGDGEHARVFWPHGEPWVDAEPRAANAEEITAVIGRALERWSA